MVSGFTSEVSGAAGIAPKPDELALDAEEAELAALEDDAAVALLEEEEEETEEAEDADEELVLASGAYEQYLAFFAGIGSVPPKLAFVQATLLLKVP
jgi:hypothetical protein